MSASPTPSEIARRAGLRHVSDEEPGIRRVRRGRGFSYHTSTGEVIRANGERDRLQALAIPPAWTDVWISPDPDGHIQATGRDAEGRKQYRYHPRWVEASARIKFRRMGTFGRALPRIRRRVRRDLRREGRPREKVLAVLVRLLDLTGLRIGTGPPGGRNGSYGLTTLRPRHVSFDGDGVRLRFRGKGGQVQEVSPGDSRLAGILQSCHEGSGPSLFQYLDESGDPHPIDADEVNDYIRAAARDDFTARDFRTWIGSVQALEALRRLPPPETEEGRRHDLAQALGFVAATLGNTPDVCREFYVHPVLIEAFLDGSLPDLLARRAPGPIRELRQVETALLGLLEDGG